VAQQFTSLKYFWPRPSAVNYNGGGSGASNKGVTNPKYIDEVNVRIDNFLVAHPYLTRIQVPMEMVTTSASGLDPHISVASAIVQMQRVAKARSVNIDDIKQLLEHEQEIPIIGIPVVNVLKLNIALDKRF
ncbi:MAG: potassium-transporting ATPase subunit C, partial [Bacteroidales bacterium]